MGRFISVNRMRVALRSSNPNTRRLALDAQLAARAFAQGFLCGADQAHARRRHEVDPFHAHWRLGFEAGRRAAELATMAYLADQLSAVEPTIE